MSRDQTINEKRVERTLHEENQILKADLKMASSNFQQQSERTKHFQSEHKKAMEALNEIMLKTCGNEYSQFSESMPAEWGSIDDLKTFIIKVIDAREHSWYQMLTETHKRIYELEAVNPETFETSNYNENIDKESCVNFDAKDEKSQKREEKKESPKLDLQHLDFDFQENQNSGVAEEIKDEMGFGSCFEELLQEEPTEKESVGTSINDMDNNLIVLHYIGKTGEYRLQSMEKMLRYQIGEGGPCLYKIKSCLAELVRSGLVMIKVNELRIEQEEGVENYLLTDSGKEIFRKISKRNNMENLEPAPSRYIAMLDKQNEIIMQEISLVEKIKTEIQDSSNFKIDSSKKTEVSTLLIYSLIGKKQDSCVLQDVEFFFSTYHEKQYKSRLLSVLKNLTKCNFIVSSMEMKNHIKRLTEITLIAMFGGNGIDEETAVKRYERIGGKITVMTVDEFVISINK